MKIITLVARILLGLLFTVFGLNGFLHFLPMQPMPGLAGQFAGALAATNYFAVIFAIQLAGGLLLLVNKYVPLALTLLAPVLVNILLFHIFMAPAGLPPGLLALVLWTIVFLSVRSAFKGILTA